MTTISVSLKLGERKSLHYTSKTKTRATHPLSIYWWSQIYRKQDDLGIQRNQSSRMSSSYFLWIYTVQLVTQIQFIPRGVGLQRRVSGRRKRPSKKKHPKLPKPQQDFLFFMSLLRDWFLICQLALSRNEFIPSSVN